MLVAAFEGEFVEKRDHISGQSISDGGHTQPTRRRKRSTLWEYGASIGYAN